MGDGVAVAGVLAAEVPAFDRACEALAFRDSRNVYDLSLLELLDAELNTRGQIFGRGV